MLEMLNLILSDYCERQILIPIDFLFCLFMSPVSPVFHTVVAERVYERLQIQVAESHRCNGIHRPSSTPATGVDEVGQLVAAGLGRF